MNYLLFLVAIVSLILFNYMFSRFIAVISISDDVRVV
jgi:hypothetical protein